MANPLNGYDTGTIVDLAQAAPPPMQMNEQERFLYDLHKQNLASGGVPNNGKTSTLYVTTIESDGKTYVLPTVWEGGIHTPNEAWEHANKIGLDKFPSYPDEQTAMNRYNQMHEVMEQDVAPVPQPEEGKVNPLRKNFLENQKLPKEEGYSIPADRPAPDRGMLDRLMMKLLKGVEQ